MTDIILVVNVGSTSFKFKLFNMHTRKWLAKGNVERVFNNDSQLTYEDTRGFSFIDIIDTMDGYTSCIQKLMDLLTAKDTGSLNDFSEISAIGFKTVLAGEVTGAQIVDEEVLKAMEDYNFVAPAHNPPYIEAMRKFKEMLPDIPQVAVFETGFHRCIPQYASSYSMPYEMMQKYQIKKYGFHGASHSYVAWKIPKVLNLSENDSLKIISCHLGGSSSICAINEGVSIDTSMGFSPQSGLPMNNRNGDLDVFGVLYVMEHEGLTPCQMRDALSTKGGLMGISGISGDVRELIADKRESAQLAVKTLAYDVKKYIGSYAAAMNGLDVLTFSGGIGENSALIREMVCGEMSYLGIEIDKAKNRSARVSAENETEVSEEESKVRIIILPTNEELMVAMKTKEIIDSIK